MENDLQQAISLIKSGNKKGGGQLLAEIVKKDPHNINAWLWLTSCVDLNEQRIYCLKKVLEVDPNHNVARSALLKLQQSQQPSEQEILGKSSARQQQANNTQSRKTTHPVSNTKTTSPTFHPRYLTAFAGVLTLMGTFFPWAALVYYGETILERYSGLTQVPGMFTAVVGVATILISLSMPTKPAKANSLISSLLALVTFLMACAWPMIFYDTCLEAFFGYACEYEIQIGTGFGYGLSMFSLFLTFILGLIPNPQKQKNSE
ncbi:MAG: tetratricopeptide repeat protein [Chloroflexota bacterium]